MKKIKSFSVVIGIIFFVIGCSKDANFNLECKSGVLKNSEGQGLSNSRKAILIEDVTGVIQKKNSGFTALFKADLYINEFTFDEYRVFAVANLNDITGTDLPSNVNSLKSKTFEIPPMVYSSVSDICGVIWLEFGPSVEDEHGLYKLNLPGLTATINRVMLEIGTDPEQNKLLGNLVCQVNDLYNNQSTEFGDIADLLNKIIEAIGVEYSQKN